MITATGTALATLAKPWRVVLLDLDGTLTKSAPGIIASVVKTFETLHVPVPSDAELQQFIGPAIIDSLCKHGIDDAHIDEAVRLYRQYYSEATFPDPHHAGKFIPGRLLNSVYKGIPEQLTKLREQGYYLAIATAKPEYQAVPICEYFKLDTFVDAIYGASKDNSRLDKDQVITYALDSMGYAPERGDRALMVGDRWTDADGARACGLDCLGCLWGYANPHELEDHGAYRVIERTAQLADAVDEYFMK